MDQWLVRTANNIIAGPYNREQVIQLIQEGKLGLQDEVCQANHFWIYLHEHAEVQKQLGINMPRAARADDEEITETQTEAAAAREGAALADISLSPLSQIPDDYEGGTALISRGSLKEARSSATSEAPGRHAPADPGGHKNAAAQAQAAAAASLAQRTVLTPVTPAHHAAPKPGLQPASVPQTDVQIERSSIWKSFAWLMIFVACLLVFAVLRLLRNPHY